MPLLSRPLPSSSVCPDPRPRAARPRISVPAKSAMARDRSHLRKIIGSFFWVVCLKLTGWYINPWKLIEKEQEGGVFVFLLCFCRENV